MNVKEELHNFNANSSPDREKIIQRIMNLSDDQFDRLITLYSQQEKGSVPTCPVPHQTSA